MEEVGHLSSGVSLNLSWSSLSSPILPSPKDQVVARPWQVPGVRCYVSGVRCQV